MDTKNPRTLCAGASLSIAADTVSPTQKSPKDQGKARLRSTLSLVSSPSLKPSPAAAETARAERKAKARRNHQFARLRLKLSEARP